MLSLSQVIPDPLRGNILNPDSIWGKEQSFLPAEKYLVCAPSGTGKTTLISCIYGLRSDYTGTILFDNENATSFTPGKWSKLRTQVFSIVFQDLRLFPQLTALENIKLKNTLTGHKPEDEITQMAERLRVGPFLGKPCGKLSLGQQQRVAIIRALVQPFRFLLLDESFSHLDDHNIELASGLISEECKKNNAAMIVTSLGDNAFFNYSHKISI